MIRPTGSRTVTIARLQQAPGASSRCLPVCRAYPHWHSQHTQTIPFSQNTPKTQLKTRYLSPSQLGRVPGTHLFSTAHYTSDSKPITIRVPAMAESITEGTVGRFNKTVGEFIEADEEIASIETDKIDVSVNAPRGGVVAALLVGEGDTVRVDQGIAEVIPGDERGDEQGGDRREEVKEGSSGGNVSSEAGKESPKDTVKDLDTPSTVESGKTQSTPEQTDVSRAEEVVKMPRIRLATAKRLKESQNTTAYLTTFNEVDMSKLLEFRKKSKDAVLEKRGVKLGFMGPMARASALALKQIPAVNASIEGEDTIVYRDYVDLSVAAAIPKGLVTPVLRNVETMGVLDIERGISELVQKAREGRLSMSDLTGGTFTISNSGVWGSLFGTPIINLPQTAVLGTYGIQDRPVAVDGRVEIRPMMYIALTYDHRIIDGREAVIFLSLIKKYLEDPESMLLG